MPSIEQIAPAIPGNPQYQIPIQAAQPKKRSLGKRIKDTVKKWAFGEPEKIEQVPTQTPQGQVALQELLGLGTEGIRDQYKGFEPIAQQAQERFSTQTIPGIAERFSSLGSGGSQRSSAFAGSNISAGQGLERQLAALKSQYGIENRNSLLQQLQLGLTPQFSSNFRPAQPGFLQNLATSLVGPGLSALTSTAGQEAGQTLGGKSYGGGGGQPQQNNSAALIKLLLPLLL